MRCLHCGFENETDALFCERCGNPITNSGQNSSFFCPECGTKNEGDALFCEECGIKFSHEPVKQTQTQKKRRSLAVPAVLALIIICVCVGAGAFFIHKKGESERSEMIRTVEKAEKQEKKSEDEKAQKKQDTERIEEQEEKETETEKEETQEPVQAPVITMQNISAVHATSELAEANMVHSASRIMDGDKNTAWVEGADGQGYGQSVRFEFNNVYLVNGIKIRAGYQKNDDIYYKNSRPKEICAEYSDGTSEVFKLEDIGQNEQVLTFSRPVETNMVNLTIESVYPGEKYEDTCISEVIFF